MAPYGYLISLFMLNWQLTGTRLVQLNDLTTQSITVAIVTSHKALCCSVLFYADFKAFLIHSILKILLNHNLVQKSKAIYQNKGCCHGYVLSVVQI